MSPRCYILRRAVSSESIQQLTDQLRDLGATKVLTYDALTDKSLSRSVKEWTSGKVFKSLLQVTLSMLTMTAYQTGLELRR